MKKLTSTQKLHSRILIMLAVGVLVLSSCGGPATGNQTPEPTTIIAVPTTPPLPTPTVDLSQARKAFEAGGELTYNEIISLRHAIVGDPPESRDFTDYFGDKEKAFGKQLANCRLKESIGWISSWGNERDSEYKILPGRISLFISMDDPYASTSEDFSKRYPDRFYGNYPAMYLVEADEKDTASMKYGQRIRFSGDLALVNGIESVKHAKFQLIEDDFSSPTPTPDELKDLRITLERTMCFGTCPDYTLTITGDGNVNFEGRNYTRVMGTASTIIDQSKLFELVKEIQRTDFFNLQDSYSANVTDNPTYMLTIQFGGKTKRVENYAAGPRKLYLLQNRIDQIVNSEQWIK